MMVNIRIRTVGQGMQALLEKAPTGSPSFQTLSLSRRRPRRFSSLFSLSTRATFSTSSTLSDAPPLQSNHRINLIFGANTDVGKTIVSAGLARAAVADAHSQKCFYLKPLQSGGADNDFVTRHVASMLERNFLQDENINNNKLESEVLFSWDTPTSPHLASRLEQKPVSDKQVLTTINHKLHSQSAFVSKINMGQKSVIAASGAVTLIETAGGVLSPSSSSPENVLPQHSQNDNLWGWRPQADLYQPLLGIAPVVLVGDGRLGGISATLSSLESLVLRGYDVAALVLIQPNNGKDAEERLQNAQAFEEYLNNSRRVAIRSGSGEAALCSVVSLPPIPADPQVPLHDWFEDTQPEFHKLHTYLQHWWQGQMADLSSLAASSDRANWNDRRDIAESMENNTKNDDTSQVNDAKYVSSDATGIPVVNSAVGSDRFVLSHDTTPSSNKLYQSIVKDRKVTSHHFQSHGDSSLALTTAAAMGRYGHTSIQGEMTHAPGVALAQSILRGPGHGWADKVFFPESGGSAMEAAFQMALKTYLVRHKESITQENIDNGDTFLDCMALQGCNHGDTLGSLDVRESLPQNTGLHPWYEPRSLLLQPPTIGFQNGKIKLLFPQGQSPTDDAKTDFDTLQEILDIPTRRLSPRLFSEYKELIEMQWLVYEHKEENRKIAFVVMEPVVGLGGRVLVDPLWQQALMDVAQEQKNACVIWDQTALGDYHSPLRLTASPDISVCRIGGSSHATLASKAVFDACHFSNPEDEQSSSHPPMFKLESVIPPPGDCISALHMIETQDSALRASKTGVPSTSIPMSFDENQVCNLSKLASVKTSFCLGTLLSITLDDSVDPHDIIQQLEHDRFHISCMENVISLVVPSTLEPEECSQLLDRIASVLGNIES